MKNIIDHDSLHRVEPVARTLSESDAKVNADAEALVKAQRDAVNEREITALPSDSKPNIENESGGQSGGKQRSRNKTAETPEEEKEPREKFMGGQLFDAEA